MSDEVLVRTVAESQSERSEIVLPADSNAIGSLFGGRLMQYIDLVGAMAASRHARAFTVTASMDRSGLCGARAGGGVADSQGECEPSVSDVDGGRGPGDGGGR